MVQRRGSSAGRAVASLVTVLLLLSACTTGTEPRPAPSPAPSPIAPPEARRGGYVGLVLPPPDGGAASLGGVRDAADALRRSPSLDVDRVRVLDAPTDAFLGDELAFLADDGADIVCTFGRSGAQAVARLASTYPQTRFCVIGAVTPGEHDNVVSVDWDDEHVAFLAGAATAAAATEDIVGLVAIGRDAVAEAGRGRASFDAGARHIRPDVRVHARGRRVTNGDAAAAAAEVAGQLLTGGATPAPTAVAVMAEEVAVAAAVEVAAEAGVVTVNWSRGDAESIREDEAVAAAIVRRVDVALVAAIRALEEGAIGTTVLTAGDGDAIGIVAGAADDAPAVVRRVREVREGLADGRAPVPDQRRPTSG